MEFEKRTLQIKNLETREQKEIARDQLKAFFSDL
jgi:histidyl-tRNA synthetase